MNKKLLFGIMSLAALTACTSDDFESQEVAQKVSPIQFEVINNDALTRAEMNGNKIEWKAQDGDLFSLYHGGNLAGAAPFYLSGCENATYKANYAEGSHATLTTPSMIKQGKAIMVWPVDTTFSIKPANNITIKIPAVQTNIENNIPYVSDLIDIGAYSAYNTTPAPGSAYNTAGKDRKYPVYMRPMASQLIIKADYAGTDATLATLEGGDDGITPISVTSIDLLTQYDGGTKFTTVIPLVFEDPTAAITTKWDTDVPYNAWSKVTNFYIGGIAAGDKVFKLTAKDGCLNGNDGCKFLILPQAAIPAAGVDQAGVIVNTYYGRVVVAANGTTYDNANYGYNPAAGAVSAYTAGEYADAWYRYISAASKTAGAGVGYDLNETVAATAESSGDNAGKFKTTANIAVGLEQTINGFSNYTATTGTVTGEPVGAAATRYVKVLLTHLDMSDLHIKNDKQLRDVARVWGKMKLPTVKVYLDGDFTISQKTIDAINDVNANATGGKTFSVMPCTTHTCSKITITGGGDVKDITFIADNGGTKANVILKAGETWTWPATDNSSLDKKHVKIGVGVNKIINEGTLDNAQSGTIILATYTAAGAQSNITLENNGTWNIKAGTTVRVQFNVTNNGTVNIAKDAQYRQDGTVQNTTFTNEATAIPSRFKNGNDNKIGKVNNNGVFATVSAGGYKGAINNFGLIEHLDVDAKTYVTHNETTMLGGYASDADFGTAFSATPGTENKMGRINLPFSNKDEDNISISAGAGEGFVSVTVTSDDAPLSKALDASVVGTFVNYIIVKSGIEKVTTVSPQIEYLEINSPGTEIDWQVSSPASYTGLMVLSPVNIKLGTTITVTGATYLGAEMFVGGTFANAGWNGYYGNTSSEVATKYITF